MENVITMYSLSECKRDNLCVDCDNTGCLHCGNLHSDCPKYYCDNKIPHDCEHCEFMTSYFAEYRKSKMY